MIYQPHSPGIEESTETATGEKTQLKTYLPKDIEAGEELTPDMSAYEMLHTVRCNSS